MTDLVASIEARRNMRRGGKIMLRQREAKIRRQVRPRLVSLIGLRRKGDLGMDKFGACEWLL